LLAQVGNPRTIPPFTVAATALAGPPAAVTVQSGQGQRGPVGALLPKPIIIQLRDSLGNALQGVAISVRTAQGAVADTDLVSGAQGRATVRWTLGPSAGDQQAEVRVDGLEGITRLTAYGIAGAPAKVLLASFSAKGAPPGAVGLAATVTDALGNPVQGASVSFASTGGVLSAARARSDVAGRATVTWTARTGLGEQRVTATISGTKVSSTQVVRAAATTTKKRN
jgi:adhesin/invasin